MIHSGTAGDAGTKAINWPRLYDLLLLLLTRGDERAYRNEVLDHAGVRAGHHVLDIGCGTGTQALETWRRVQPRGTVVGVDVSPNMIARARHKTEKAGLTLRFEQSDAAALPFNEGQFDVVTLTTVMHMVPQARRPLCLREARRVLKPGGRLLIIDYAGDPNERTDWVAKRGMHRRFDLHSLRGMMADAEFADVRETALSRLSLHALTAVKR